MIGLLRSLVVAAAGVGLVLGATQVSAPLDLVPPAVAVPALAAHADPVATAQAICPGPEALGVAGL
ncbi:MAG: hypothetical protein ABI438_10145, partial [Dermatophilaceae bacterium]